MPNHKLQYQNISISYLPHGLQPFLSKISRRQFLDSDKPSQLTDRQGKKGQKGTKNLSNFQCLNTHCVSNLEFSIVYIQAPEIQREMVELPNLCRLCSQGNEGFFFQFC